MVSAGDVDLAGFHIASNIAFAAQVKNAREWIYEADEVIWHLFGAAYELGAVPILIARRVPETTFRLMDACGGHAFRTVKMILPPKALDMKEEGEMTFGEALDDLGFLSDVDFLERGAPLDRHIRLWSRGLPPRLEVMQKRFTSIGAEVKRIAFDEGLRSRGRHGKLTGRSRKALVDELMHGLA